MIAPWLWLEEATDGTRILMPKKSVRMTTVVSVASPTISSGLRRIRSSSMRRKAAQSRSVFMTPRLHGIHHSVVGRETDSNWGTILSLPDWLHGTALVDVPQQTVTIGAPGVLRDAPRDLRAILAMPFTTPTPVPSSQLAP